MQRHRSLRVLFWSELFLPYPGGTEFLAAQFLKAMQPRGVEFTVVTSHDHVALPDAAHYEGIPVHRLPFRAALRDADPTRFIAARQQLARLKREVAPDLIHLFTLGPSALFHLQTAAAYPSPFMVTLHGEVLRGRVGGHDSVFEKTLRAADWVTGVSSAVLSAARGWVPEILSRSSVLYTGLADPAIPPTPLPRDTQILLCVGRLVQDKGFDVALDAFANLIRRFPHARLVIAGDGPLRGALAARAHELGLGDRVEFLGWVAPQQVPHLLNAASVVLMPSRREGMPLVALQAAQQARPVVASRAGGLPEVVADGETGVVVAPEDGAGLAHAAAGLLQDPERAERMGLAAKRRAQQLFNERRYLGDSLALYQRLRARAQGPSDF